MITFKTFSNRFSRRFASAAAMLVALAALNCETTQARPVPANLGNGLDKLVASDLAINNANGRQLPGLVNFNGKSYTDEATAMVAASSLGDAKGRLLVRITLNGKFNLKQTRANIIETIKSVTVTAVDTKYRGVGIMNAYVAVSDVPKLAQAPGVAAVILEWRPRHAKVNAEAQKVTLPPSTVGETLAKLGTDFDSGVTQERVDQLNMFYNASASSDYEGQGMQVACISNSYNAHTAKPASTDVTNWDLPGAANNPVNTTPVYVFLDDLSSTSSDDEGRGMCQIVYKMAPKAAVAFGTADTGEVGFANVIRGLAGIAGYTNPGQTFAADTECDDVGYYDEPYFQDGIIGDGVDDASGAGVAYFSSAGNDIGTNGYDSALRWVANGTGLTSATNSALTGTNINLANVPASLYAGGFHNFNPAAGQQDVAQTVNDPSNSSTPTVLQWNEPYDQTATPNNEILIWTQAGNYTASTDNAYTFNITPSLTAGTIYELDEIANGDGFDGAITILAPDGSTVVPRQDNSVDEVVRFVAPTTGTGYQVIVGHYSTTMGAYTLNLYSTTGFSGNTVSTQVSLLVFDTSGNYIPTSSLVTNGIATDEPLQLGYTVPTTGSQVQFVIARANVSTAPTAATHVRYVIPGNGASGLGPAEYFSYNTVTTGGHAMAETCNGMAAYGVFRPSLPETFTSPGPVTIYFDKMNNPLGTPEIRLQPHFAANDAANVSSNMSFFASDSSSDPDTNGNFSGTSAAGPHAAAIAALVLQAHSGHHSITPAQMTTLLENNTYAHDLDPNFSSGAARITGGSTGSGKVVITISSDSDSSANTGSNDTNAFTISYIGGSSITSFVFNPGGTSATAGNPSGGNNGVIYSLNSTTVGGTVTYFENSLPGVAFFPSSKAFTLGTGVTGATAAFTNLSGSTNQYYTMTITIPPGNFAPGSLLEFTVGRGLARSATTGNTYNLVTSATSGGTYYCADIFGGGVSLPNGTTLSSTTAVGMAFSGTTADGGTFNGTINNRIGYGWAPTDGFGLINAQAAVAATVH